MNHKKILISMTAFCFILVLMVPAFAEQTLDPEEKIKERINNDPQTKNEILNSIFPNPDRDNSKWDLTKFSFKDLKNTEFRLERSPSDERRYLTSTLFINCSPNSELSRTLTLEESLTSTATITKSINFEYQYTVSAGFNIKIFCAGVSQTFNVGYTSSWENSEITTDTITDTYGVAIKGRGGQVSSIETIYHNGGGIPFTATCVPDDQTPVNIEFQGSGYAEVYEDYDYKKSKQKFQVGTEIPDLRKSDYKFWNDRISSVKIYGEVTLILYENENYGGKERKYSSNVAKIDFWDFNDKATSLKVIPNKLINEEKILFTSIAKLIPIEIQQFTIKGTIDLDINHVRDVEIISYELSEELLNQECSNTSPKNQSRKLSKEEFIRLLQEGKLREK